MDIYSSLLERIRVSQPSMQRFAVISIFEKLRSAPSNLDADSDPGRTAISHCLQSNSAHVVDQSIRELCRHVKEGDIDVSRGLLELQSGLEGCDSRFVDVFVKGIGFLVNFSFQKNGSLLIFDSPEAHPFVKVLSCRSEVHSELVKQVLLFVVRNKAVGFVVVCEFLRPFLNFSILRIPFSEASSSFAKHLVSSIASLCCSFSSKAMPFIKLLIGCLKYFPLKNVQDFRDMLSVAEYLVEAFVVVLRVVVEAGLPTNDSLLCGVELLETLLSFYVNLEKHSSGKEAIVELSKRVLVVHRELGLQFPPELSSVIISMFLILTRAEFEHEQLSILKLSVLLLRWKRENESNVAQTVCDLNEELLLIFPVINLLSSPSRSVKAAATDLLSILEKILIDSLIARKKVPISQERSPSVSKPESIISRLLQNLWLQDQSSAPSSYFLAFSSDRKTKVREINSELKSWIPQLREYCIMIAERQKTQLISRSQENVLTDMPLLLGSVASLMIMHRSLGSYAVDSLAAIGVMDPTVGLPLLLGILFYSRLCYNNQSSSHETVLKLLNILPSIASHSVMVPLVVQTILPMLQRDTKPVLRATAIRLLCKTWEVTDRVFGNLQGILQSNAFHEFKYDRNTCLSMAASIRDVCRKNPDRGVDLILSVSACIESRDPAIQVLGFQSLGHLCEADVVDFYTAWDVIEKHVLDYSVDPIVAHGLCILLRWGALDAEAYSEASKSIMHIIWEVATSKRLADGYRWAKARASAYESLIHYEVEHIRKNIPDFGKRNIEMLIYEDNPDVLNAVEQFEFKIITFEHITRRRVLKEKRVVVNKVEKLLDVFPQVIFRSGKRSSNTRELPGAALLCLSFTPKEVHSPGTSEELQKLHAAYENAVVEIADSLQLSRNILVALLSMQSWKPFMHRWMRAVFMFLDANMPTTGLDKTSKAGDDILKRIRRIAEESVPRSAENIVLAIAALCMVINFLCWKLEQFSDSVFINVLPPSAHTTTVNASKFLLKWLYQYEHEHRQWSAAIGLGLVSSCLHATDRKQKFQIITGLLKVSSNSKSSLVKGACGVGLGFACQDLLTRVEAADGPVSEETDRLMESNLLGKIVKTYSLIISQLSPSSFDSLQNLCKYFPQGTDDIDAETTGVLLCKNDNYLEEDVWGFAGVIIGLGNSVGSLYRVGGQDAVIRMKALLTSWIPHVNSVVLSSCDSAESEILLSVGACLALPTVVAFCQRVELIDDDELNHLVDGYTELISELLSAKKSGMFHQSLLMAACIGAGSLLSCILDEGVHSMKSEDIKHLLELCQKSYTDPYPPIVHFGGMLGVVNAMGAGVGTLTHIFPKSSSLQTSSGQKESSYIRGPILSTPVCEPLSTSLMQEMFLVAQDSKDQQLQKYASWAVSFLRHRWCSKDLQTVNKSSQSNQMDSTALSQSFSEDSVVWQLCMWLRDLSNSEDSTITSVNTVESVLRCLSRAPRLPLSLDWGAIIRRCMRYKDQVSGKLIPDRALKTGSLREQCLRFALAHANQVKPLLFFLDELTDLFRFRTLEVNLQMCLLSNLADLIKNFSGSRLEKLFDDMADYFSSASSYQVYHPDQKTLLRVSFWKGLYRCLDEASNESPEYITNMEKCMELLFVLLPTLHFDANQRVDQIHSTKEWSEAVRCMGRARRGWLMDILEVPDLSLVRAGYFIDVVKQIQARARLVVTGWIPLIELGKLKAYILNAKFDGIWDVLVDVVAALQCSEGSIKRQWLVDAVEISCITKYPSTVLQFIGLLSSSCCKYMPFLLLDRVSVLSDLPVTLPSLLSHSSWREIAEPVVLNLWTSTQRTYSWAKCLSFGEDMYINHQQPIDKTENGDADYLSCLMHHTCVSLKDYLPFEKQLELANMVVPAKNRVGF